MCSNDHQNCSCVLSWSSSDSEGSCDTEGFEEDTVIENIDQCATLSCDTCEKEFWTYELYQRHFEEHTVCGIDGCQFTAHQKIIEKHIRMQHATGLYDKIRNVQTPEDIAKWIADRKKNFPAKRNIERQNEKQAAMESRGERIGERKNKFGRDKSRLMKSNSYSNKTTKYTQKQNLKKRKPVTKKHVSIIDEKFNWNNNMYPFRGTKELVDETGEMEEETKYDDSEWNTESRIANTPKTTVNNSLNAIMGAYLSDDYTDNEDVMPSSSAVTLVKSYSSETVTLVANNAATCSSMTEVPCLQNNLTSNLQHEQCTNIVDDDDQPVEEKISRTPVIDVDDAVINDRNSQEANESVEGNQSGHKRKRKRPSKVNSVESKEENRTSDRLSKQATTDKFPYKNFKKRRVTLLERLLDSEIRQERNVILQCVRSVVSSNFFRDIHSSEN